MRVMITPVAQAAAGQVHEIALTRLSAKVVTAVRTGLNELKIIVWHVGANGALTRQGDAQAGGVTQVSLTDWPEGPGVVTAVRTLNGDLKVIVWKVTTDGNIQRLGDSTAGPVSEVVISSPSGFVGVVTPVRTASGELKVIAWKLSATGVITRMGDADGGPCSALTVTALSSVGGVARIATALRNASGNLEIITWAISALGLVARLHEGGAGPISGVAITYRSTANADLVTVTKGTSDDLTVIGWAVKDDGNIERLTTAQGGNVAALAVTTWKPDIHSYVVAALRTDGSGKLKLIVWRNGADLKRHGELTDADVHEVAVTNWENGVITATRNADGNLHLTSWALKPAGIKLLHREWPASAAVAQGAPGPLHLVIEPPLLLGEHQDYSHYGELPIITAPQPPANDPDGSATLSLPWQKRFFPAVSGVDPMLAVGHQYIIVTQDHQIAFFDRDGAPLPSKAGEVTNLSATTFFAGFIAAKNPDGTPNSDNINLYSPLEIKEFYDTRVTYDAPSKRFVVLSAARKEGGAPPPRYFALAVSKTEDPRDGFHQYMTTESNYRDFPRLTVHGERVLVAHNAAALPDEGDTPLLYAFDYPSLRQGVLDPPNWQYYASDLAGAARIFLVSHHGDSGGLTLLFDIRGNDPKLRIAAFSLTGQPWQAPTPLFATVTLGSQASWPGPFGVYRNKTLHIAGSIQITARIPNVAPARNSIRTTQVPFSLLNTSQITINAAGIVDRFFGLNASTDAPSDKVTYEVPGIAVNKHGDVIYVYGRTGVETENPLFPEARYSVWLHGEPKQRRSRLLQAGSYQPTKKYDGETVATSITHALQPVDYATGVVDPTDDETFWVIHEYADDVTKSWKTVVGMVSPTPIV